MLEMVDKNVFEIMTLLNNLVFLCRFYGHNYTLYDSRKMFFYAKIWFVKTSTRIVKYKSRVVKLNPVMILLSISTFSANL